MLFGSYNVFKMCEHLFYFQGVYRSSSISSRHPQEYNEQDSPQQRHYKSYQRESGRSPPRRNNRNIPAELRHPHSHYAQQKVMQV